GRTVAEALPEAAGQGYLELLDGVFASGVPYNAVGHPYGMQVAPDGPVDQRYLDFVYQPIRDAQGTVIGIFVQGSDVTDRVRVEQRRDALIQLSDQMRNARSVADLS